jgi:hypothetical protein
MKDMLDRDISPGDYFVFPTTGGRPKLRFGKVLEVHEHEIIAKTAGWHSQDKRAATRSDGGNSTLYATYHIYKTDDIPDIIKKALN